MRRVGSLALGNGHAGEQLAEEGFRHVGLGAQQLREDVGSLVAGVLVFCHFFADSLGPERRAALRHHASPLLRRAS